MKPIFHPKWPPSTHNSKLVEFLEYFCKPNMSIYVYANQFKCLLHDLQYNGITITPDTAKNSFMQGLGAEFIAIRNMSQLPSEFNTEDIDALTMATREHLARVLGNHAIQKQQQQVSRGATQPQQPQSSSASSAQAPPANPHTTTPSSSPSAPMGPSSTRLAQPPTPPLPERNLSGNWI